MTNKFNYNDKNYDQYATEIELEALESARNNGGSATKAGIELGKSRSTIKGYIKRIESKAKKSGYIPDNGMSEPFDSSLLHVKSTVHVKDGEVKQYWARLQPDLIKYEKARKQALLDFVKDLPKIKPTKYTKKPAKDLLACYPLGDPHIGMMAWGEESGQDWDLKIATKAFTGVFHRLVNSTPSCEQAVIFNLGDYFHVDNMRGMTERGGHSQDTDGRFAKMKRVGYKIMRMMIEHALEHHKKVRVINSIGNHDDTGAIDMAIALAEIYSDEPRLTVDTAPTPFHYVRFGDNIIGSHHGHTTKIDKLPLVMATDRAKDWGETKNRYWYTGHIHHDSMKEFSGCKVESFRTLAAKDAYATWHGYRAGQDSKAIVIHKEYGEIERHTVNLGMI